MELREPVDGRRERRSGARRGPAGTAREQLGRRMVERVELAVVGRIGQPEVGSKVDHQGAGLGQIGREGCGLAVRQREQDGVEVGRGGKPRLDMVAGLREVREGFAERCAVPAPGRERHDPDVGVALQEANELGADVPGGAEDAYPDRPAASWCAGRGTPAARPETAIGAAR